MMRFYIARGKGRDLSPQEVLEICAAGRVVEQTERMVLFEAEDNVVYGLSKKNSDVIFSLKTTLKLPKFFD